MKDFFPPDVSVRLRGDTALARTHLGEAKRMLFKGLNMGVQPVRLIQFFDDGSTAHLLISGNQKIVTVVAPPPVPQPEEVPPLREEEEERIPRPSVMLSGWMRAPYNDYRPSPANQSRAEFQPGILLLPDAWRPVGQGPAR